MLSRLLPLVALMVVVVQAPAAPPEIAPPPRPGGLGLPVGADPSLADWTPRAPKGKSEAWEIMGDKDWIDARFRSMDTGPALNCTMRYPLGKDGATIFKAIVVKLGDKGEASLAFDRNTLQLAAAWTGGYLNHSDRRFGLLNTPTPKGDMMFAAPPSPGWANPDGQFEAKSTKFTAPLPREWAKYRGHYVHGNRVVFSYSVGGTDVLESPRFADGRIARTFLVGPSAGTLRLAVPAGVAVSGGEVSGKGGVHLAIAPSKESRKVTLTTGTTSAPAEDLLPLTKGGPKRWGESIVTKLERGDDTGPFAIDTLTIPHKNPFGALFFCTGLDHLPDGRVAVCTCHGDVWLVTVSEKAGTCSWQRYATGLYHALGLKVIDGKVVVLERGQLTRLHDLNNDGEADFYECVNNDWHTGGGEHSYDTCLETDPQGNFYFFKTGDTDTPTGGCLMKVSKDGSKSEVFATGFRHPIGMGMSDTGILTGADQEGNWMPATRIDEYKRGGFYGDMRAHHRKDAPKIYDPPLCWLPRQVDNSAGGQVWVPEKTFGPLAGLPLHFSYGRCKPFVLLRQECDDGVQRVTQGGVADLGLKFLSGVCRGRFGADGYLYVCGLNGWQTAAQADGCVQRVRMTGKPLDIPVKMAVVGNTIRLAFSRPLNAESVTVTQNYKAAWWNYRWSGDYGSKRWKVSDPNAEGQDDLTAKSAKLLDDGKTVEVRFDKLQPVMQMQFGYNLLATDGRKVVGSVYLTIHTTGK